ncbi:MAG: tRNA (guanosine(46)-N7)-methyltransferase TrmB [Gammaproteobacteria bacterium]|nr:tRNA (guanosine(46)-N7)-methyltransferase TrmB [Gammaproteobacteria bacterium]
MVPFSNTDASFSGLIISVVTNTIRSYVRREGRFTRAQRNAFDKYWDKYGVEFNCAKTDLDTLFNRHAPKIMDIGTGMGDATIEMATAHPENDYLAVEVHRPGVGSLLKQIETRQLNNIRVFNHDVIEILTYQIPDNSLDIVYIFFPDPWPKKRHHKRRLINHKLLDCLMNCLKANARIFIATDWEDYARHILEIFETKSGFINLSGAGRYAPRPRWRPNTKFEQKGKNLNHCVWDLVFACRK